MEKFPFLFKRMQNMCFALMKIKSVLGIKTLFPKGIGTKR